GGYVVIDGTSMATPLVAGVAALLRQADPDLSPDQIATIIRATARPIGPDPVPNNNVGAGLVDAYAALSYLLGSGELTGRVTRLGDGGPIAGAEVSVTSLGTGASIRLTTDATGAYTVPLQAGLYEVAATAFGYQAVRRRAVSVGDGAHVRVDFELALLPVGVILGRVTDTAGAPLAATVIVENTPVTTTAQAANGAYSVALPPGTYRLRVEQRGHRIGRAQVTVPAAGAVAEQNFSLPSAPTILLVDTGGWYAANTTQFYEAALDARDYLHTTHIVRSVQNNGLTLDKLKAYDIVVWSSPGDAPRLVGADRLLADYLRQGGRLIISGQDIAYWDGGGTGVVTEYFRNMLNARYVVDNGGATAAQGAGPLAGLTWQLNGADSADNQTSVDVIEQVKPEAGTVAALYPGDRRAGVLVDTCVPHRSLYLAFGVEGVRGLANRAELLDRAIQTVAAPTPARALTLYAPSQAEVAGAGAFITYTLRLRNIGAENDTYTVRVTDARWPTQVLDPATGRAVDSLSLDKCMTRDLAVSVRIPPGTDWNTRDTATVQVMSRGDNTVPQTVQLVSKTPAPVLLVDDDQFVNVQDVYTRALQLGGVPYDDWDSGQAGTQGRGSPPADRLNLYPVVVWFTGYDFLDTLSSADEARLTTYLNNGGRLLLSSQDYLFTAGLTRFAADYLGVLTHTEDLQTVTLVGVRDDPVGDGLGPFALDFQGVLGSTRYNHSDALTPNAFAQAAFIGSHGRPVGIRRDAGRYRTAFFALPIETLGSDHLALVLRRALGWLGPLGASQMSADKAIAADGDTVTFSLDIRSNTGLRRERVRLENPLPAGAQIVPDSLIGGTLENGRVVWEGPLAPGETHGVRYRVTVPAGLPPGAELVNRGTLVDETGLQSEVFTRVRVNVPDLSPSVALADKTQVYAGDVVNFTLSLRNRGALDATTTVTATLPAGLSLVPGSLAASSGTATADG
ncbi:MAG: carboxypeptidase regulatory-like domain-containing protein, partial [Anaerolineae bacterium]|nr:carboxypeptidase regulatory-like domain-containing protein [Anaerolineae bacterium]